MKPDLSTLLTQLDPHADLPHRHVWLIAIVDWLRGDGSSPEASVNRLKLLLDAAQVRPELAAQINRWWQVLVDTVDSTMVLADYGFSPRMAFFSEAAYRLGRKILPGTPETTDASELFGLVMCQPTIARPSWSTMMPFSG